MSWDVDGTGDALLSSWSAVTAPPFSMSVWFCPDSVTIEGHLMSINDASSLGLHNLSVDVGNSSELSARSFAGSWAGAQHADTLVIGTLYHAAGIWASTTSRTVILDGVWANRVENTTSKVPTGIDQISLGAQYYNSTGPNEEFNGRLAHAALWSAELVQGEIEALALGVSPLLIRPGALVFYAPLDRDLMDVMGNASLSAVGNAAYSGANEPRIMRPSAQILRFPSTAVAGGLSIPVAMHSYRRLRANS